MAGVYDAQTKRAFAKIKAKGELCTWFKPGPNTDVVSGLPWEPDPQAGTSFSNISIVWTPGKSSRYQSLMVERGSSDDLAGFEFGLLSGLNLPFTPEFRDGISRSDGTLLYLTAFRTLAPNGPVILYFLTAQR
jgi:hypothetical protein